MKKDQRQREHVPLNDADAARSRAKTRCLSGELLTNRHPLRLLSWAVVHLAAVSWAVDTRAIDTESYTPESTASVAVA